MTNMLQIFSTVKKVVPYLSICSLLQYVLSTGTSRLRESKLFLYKLMVFHVLLLKDKL